MILSDYIRILKNILNPIIVHFLKFLKSIVFLGWGDGVKIKDLRGI